MTVGGDAALSADFLDAVYGSFPLMLTLICLLTFLLLARAFRSLILPLKAVLLNLLSVGAAWGLIVLVFQKGFGSGDLGHRGDAGDQRRAADRDLRLPVRRLDGLPGVHHQPDAGGVRPHRLDRDRRHRGHRPHRPARDERGADPRSRVRRRSAPRPGTEAKIFATALGGGILIDATIIRGILAPAAVALLGRWNWWLPGWAARVLRVEPSGARVETGPEPAPQPA